MLAEDGTSLNAIVRATYDVTDRDDAEAVLSIYGRLLATIRPAATTVIAAGLLKLEMRVEIKVTAALE